MTNSNSSNTTLSNFIENLKYLDIFPQNTSFTDKGKVNFRSWTGVVLSLLVIISSIILGWMFGSELYKRQKPMVSSSLEYNSESKIVLNEIPMFIILSDGYGNKIDIEGLYNLRVFRMFINENGISTFSSMITDQFPLVKCNYSHFSRIIGKISKEVVIDILNLPAYCFDMSYGELIIQNPYKHYSSSFINFHITRNNCTETNMNITNSTFCSDNYSEITTQAYVEFFFLDTYINSFNYTHPINYFFNSKNTQISSKYLKRNFIKLSNNYYISDNGWMIEDKKEIKYYSKSSCSTETNELASGFELDNLWITLEVTSFSNNTHRSYYKVPEFFARIGGLVNAFMIMIKILFSHYLRFNYIMSLKKYLNVSKDDEITNFSDSKISTKLESNNCLYFDNHSSYCNVINKERDSSNKTNTCKDGNRKSSYVNTNKVCTLINNRRSFDDKKTRNFSNNNINVKNNYKSCDLFDLKNEIRSKSICISNIRESNSVISRKHRIIEKIDTKKQNSNNMLNVGFSDSYYGIENTPKIEAILELNNYRCEYKNKKDLKLKYNKIRNKLDPENANSAHIASNVNNCNNNESYEQNNTNSSKHNILNIKNSFNINSNNNKSNKINSVKKIQPLNLINVYTSNKNIYFNYIDFSYLNYLKYLSVHLTCRKKNTDYEKIRHEIDSLYDIYNFSSFLQNQYLKKELINKE